MKYLLLFSWLICNVHTQNPSKESFVKALFANPKARFYVVIPTQKNQDPYDYYLTTNNELYRYYLKNKNALSYQDFIYKLLEKKISYSNLTSKDYSSFIKGNVLIMKEYQKYGLSHIKRKYLKRIGNEWRNTTSDPSVNDTVIKIMVDNYYIAYYSGYSGFYSFKEQIE
jgi:hypothetical protein